MKNRREGLSFSVPVIPEILQHAAQGIPESPNIKKKFNPEKAMPEY
jgi:hypothetical protein